ncbi:MAG: DMT family transporter [Pseudomonadota bacterium]
MIKTNYLSVIIIWCTTPLAIQWSIQSGMLFGLMSRLSLGLLVLAIIYVFSKQKLQFNKVNSMAFIAVGIGIYFSMLFVYMSAQYIPSGWISVIFGLSPIITGVFSIIFLNENHFTKCKTIGMLLGLSGLIVIFYTSSELAATKVLGVFLMLTSTIAHAGSAVIVKKINAPITGKQSTFGGLLIAVPLIILTFVISGHQMGELTPRSIGSIIYLGAIGTAAGFSMYYYILKKLDAIKVSLIALVSPVIALILGIILNNEPFSMSIVIGGVLIISGLALFESYDKKSQAVKEI